MCGIAWLQADDGALIRRLAKALLPVLGRTDADAVVDTINALLLDPSQLVKHTTRVAEISEVMRQTQSSSVTLDKIFSVNHHVRAATSFFKKYKSSGKNTQAVVFGHKNQGKTQFLYFLTRLLQALGEGVVYLDKTITPEGEGEGVWTEDPYCCVSEWHQLLLGFLKQQGQTAVIATAALEQYVQSGTIKDFRALFRLLERLRHTDVRVWMIVDEAAADQIQQQIPWVLPEDQKVALFNFIITGSVGIATLVSKRHLGKWCWDLPMFTPAEASRFAVDLHAALEVGDDLWEALGIKKTADDTANMGNLGETLEELFGGVPGYTAELLLALKNGEALSQYVKVLSDRVRAIIVEATARRSITAKELSEEWLNEMRVGDNNWAAVRDSGLCGSNPPRGVIFSKMLQWLFVYAPEADHLTMVQSFRSMFSNDPGLDGNLLELEEILKFQRGTPRFLVLLHLEQKVWVPKPASTIELPSTKGQSPNHCSYDESKNIVTVTMARNQSEWFGVELPSGFCVIDFLLAHVSQDTLHFYLIQITRSPDPFAKHDTNTTCTEKSKTRIMKLLAATGTAITMKTTFSTTSMMYAMIAPNAHSGKEAAPGQQEPYYFYPSPGMPAGGGGGAPERKKTKKGC